MHSSVVSPLAVSQYAEQNFWPGGTVHRQPSIAHLFESADIVPPAESISVLSDAHALLRDGARAALSATLQQMSRVFQTRFGQLGAAQHSGNLLCPLRIFHAANLRLRAPTLLGLLDQKVLIPECRDLR